MAGTPRQNAALESGQWTGPWPSSRDHI